MKRFGTLFAFITATAAIAPVAADAATGGGSCTQIWFLVPFC